MWYGNVKDASQVDLCSAEVLSYFSNSLKCTFSVQILKLLLNLHLGWKVALCYKYLTYYAMTWGKDDFVKKGTMALQILLGGRRG